MAFIKIHRKSKKNGINGNTCTLLNILFKSLIAFNEFIRILVHQINEFTMFSTN